MIEKKTIIEDLTMDLPSNSHKSKEEVKQVKKVIKGEVVTKKKGFFGKFREAFTGDDTVTVSSYVFYDVLVPALKNTLFEMISGGSEMFLFGNRRNERIRRDRGSSYISYNNPNRRIEERRREEPVRRSNSFDDVILQSKYDAEEVLTSLVDLVDNYGSASLADLYDLVGITSQFTDNKYGWYNLASARVERVRHGYLISLPKVRPLD